jgi:nucleoid-associated protein YgaU
MNYPLQALIKMGVVPTVTFPTDSRYYGSATLTYTAPDGSTVSYLARRFVPQPGAPNYTTVAQYTVKPGDRLDLIAAKYLGDPLMFWLICDANGAIRPEDLTDAEGTVLNITLPRGVPGASNA